MPPKLASRANLVYEKRAWGKGFSVIAGVDEAGRGPLAGPVVAGAVILKTTDFTQRVDDSKKLTAKQRERAFCELAHKSIFAVGLVDSYTIDKINIANATILAMKRALFNLLVKPDFVLVDGILKIGVDTPCEYIKSGDAKSLSIAAASIIAKVTRDNIMVGYHKKYPEYDFIAHKGYGTHKHFYIIHKKGPCAIHRKSFLTGLS